uniref:Secreted protein n=1 Tax=Strongyloides papillosus TaxID=174720 RepID=A0A0N5BI44_STREA
MKFSTYFLAVVAVCSLSTIQTVAGCRNRRCMPHSNSKN